MKMKKICVLLGLMLVASGTALAYDSADVMATVRQFVDGFNKGDAASALATCANDTAIIDDFPPHQWQTCAAWLKDYDADAKKNGITDGVVTLGKPWHVDVSEDRAYVVVPADFTFKQKGKTRKQAGSTFTLVLQKQTAGWRLVSWAWGAH